MNRNGSPGFFQEASPEFSVTRFVPKPKTIARLCGLLLLIVVAGASHGASWVFPGWWPGAWIGQGLLLTLAVSYRPRTSFLAGLVIGCLGIGWAFSWAPAALQLCFDAPWVASHAIYAVLVLWESAVFGLACGWASYFAQRRVWGLALAPVAWVVAEFWWPRIFPWLLGYSQLDLLPLLQVAELTGSCGVSFVITATATLPAAWLVYRRAPQPALEFPRFAQFSAAMGILFVAVWGWGQLRIGQWEERLQDAPQLRVGLIQVDPSFMGAETKLRNESLHLQDQVDLICWPESAIGYYSCELADFRDAERTLASSRHSHHCIRPSEGLRCELLAGGKSYRPGVPEEGPYSMTAFLIDPAERIRGRYLKRTLLPFGEYIPGQVYFPGLREWATLQEINEAGVDARPLVTARGDRLGVVICYEDMLRGNVHETVNAGAEILFSLINGSVFEDPLTMEQHKRLAQMRAVEHRRYFVRCASTGVSCVISPTGEIVRQIGVNEESALAYPCRLIQEKTVYSRCGEFFPGICTAALLVAWLSARRRRAHGELTISPAKSRTVPLPVPEQVGV